MLKNITLESIRNPVKSDLAEVDNLIIRSLNSDVELVQQIGNHLIQSGGKRLRPLLALLSAKSWQYDGSAHINLAAIIEFIHTSTLLHDDVVDNSSLRRGKKTANALWGNESSVLVGDFLYSRAFQMLTQLNNIPIMQILTKTTTAIAEGEVLQLMNRHNPEISEANYMQVINYKTAKLFEAAAHLGACIANTTPAQQIAMANYGMHLGLAFQIVDDVLDYSSSAEEMGKNIGDDLAEGKITLPLIYAMQQGSANIKNLIHHAIKNGTVEQFDNIFAAIQETNALVYANHVAQKEVDLAHVALEQLPDSPYKDALYELALFAIQRDH